MRSEGGGWRGRKEGEGGKGGRGEADKGEGRRGKGGVSKELLYGCVNV